MAPKIILILSIVLLSACDNSKTKNEEAEKINVRIALTDSTRAKVINVVDNLISSNSSPDDTTISARFINQGKYKNGDSYIKVDTKNGGVIILNNPMPLDETDIPKLKKDGNNITLTYTRSDKSVKFLAAEYEPKK